MAFELPTKRTDTAAQLRQLESIAPVSVPKDTRATLIHAAEELEHWRKLGDDIARQLEEIAEVRVSEMASASRVGEIQREFKNQLLEAARRLKAMP